MAGGQRIRHAARGRSPSRICGFRMAAEHGHWNEDQCRRRVQLQTAVSVLLPLFMHGVLTCISLVVIVSLRLLNFPRQYPSDDPMLRLDLFVVWSQVQMIWSVTSATIPSLRPFLCGLSTCTQGLGGSSTDPNSRRAYASGYELSDLRPDRIQKRHWRRNQADQKSSGDGLRDFVETIGNGIGRIGHSNNTTVVAQQGRAVDEQGSMDSGDSQNMIIQKDVHFEIDCNAPQTSE